MSKNPYQVLGVNETTTYDELKSIYRHLAKIYHPDNTNNTTKMQEINLAYEELEKKIAKNSQPSKAPDPHNQESKELNQYIEKIKLYFNAESNNFIIDYYETAKSNINHYLKKLKTLTNLNQINELKTKIAYQLNLLERSTITEYCALNHLNKEDFKPHSSTTYHQLTTQLSIFKLEQQKLESEKIAYIDAISNYFDAPSTIFISQNYEKTKEKVKKHLQEFQNTTNTKTTNIKNEIETVLKKLQNDTIVEFCLKYQLDKTQIIDLEFQNSYSTLIKQLIKYKIVYQEPLINRLENITNSYLNLLNIPNQLVWNKIQALKMACLKKINETPDREELYLASYNQILAKTYITQLLKQNDLNNIFVSTKKSNAVYYLKKYSPSNFALISENSIIPIKNIDILIKYFIPLELLLNISTYENKKMTAYETLLFSYKDIEITKYTFNNQTEINIMIGNWNRKIDTKTISETKEEAYVSRKIDQELVKSEIESWIQELKSRNTKKVL